jgi:hypothetical protein
LDLIAVAKLEQWDKVTLKKEMYRLHATTPGSRSKRFSSSRNHHRLMISTE